MSAPRRFFLATLGCRINQYESQALREAWSDQGLVETTQAADADLILVNACAVTARAVRDARKTIRCLARQAPAARLVVTGCAAQVMAPELAAMDEVQAVVPQSAKALLARHPDGDLPRPDSGPDPHPFQDSTVWGAVRGSSRSRPVLKVQDGCSRRCAFCIVPLARGPARSREPAEVLAEAEGLLGAGFRELVISGVNLGQYGRGLDRDMDFWDLVALLDRALAPRWQGRARLRLSSLDPGLLGPKALDVLGAARLACPHLHLSLQTLSPTVLARMGRGHYGPDLVARFVERLSELAPVFGLGADLLAGFPGETEAEFQEGLAAVAALPLTYAHVFPYSRRPGTRAAAMPGHLPQAVKKQRAAALRALAAERRAGFARCLAALPRLKVVVLDNGQGLSEHFAHCDLVPGPQGPAPGRLALARPLGVRRGRLEAVLLGPAPGQEDRP